MQSEVINERKKTMFFFHKPIEYQFKSKKNNNKFTSETHIFHLLTILDNLDNTINPDNRGP